MPNPLVSIVIPIYNGTNYMREAIDSALAQTYKNIEVIVVNDGSTDSTEEIAKSYGDKIRYFAKENGGVSTALNLAIKNSRGEYISWLSHDDVYYPEKIERQIKEFSRLNDSAVVLFSDYEFMNDRSEIIGPMALNHRMLEMKPEYSLLRGCINGITLLIPKKAFEEYGEFDDQLKCVQDYEMWNLMMRTYKFIHMPVILAKHRIHPGQDTKNNPNVVTEGDAFWIKAIDRIPAVVKIRLEGDEYHFYSEMALFLKKTPYNKAYQICVARMKKHSLDYRELKRFLLPVFSFMRSDIWRDRVKFAMLSPRKFFKKHFFSVLDLKKLRKLMKKYYLFLNDRTIRTRFFFDGEYERWKAFDAQRINRVTSFVSNKKRKRGSIYFLVPGTEISGGIAVIFRHANMLLDKGYDVKILSLNNKNSEDWYPNQKVKIIPYSQTRSILKSGEIDILIATAYSTAYTVDMTRARRKFYFVQSDESRFYPDDKMLTEAIRNTYSLSLEYIVIAHWLQDWLRKEFNQNAYYVPLGLDSNIFRETEPIKERTDKFRVLVEGAIDVPYKGMDDAMEAVRDLGCEIWIVSGRGKPKPNWKYDRFFEKVSLKDMPAIYSSCDILLKMSKVESFCYPPLEMMACGGVSVIRKVTGIEEYAINEYNCLIVNDVTQARLAIQRLIQDKKLRRIIVENGYRTSQEWDWQRSNDLFEQLIKG